MKTVGGARLENEIVSWSFADGTFSLREYSYSLLKGSGEAMNWTATTAEAAREAARVRDDAARDLGPQPARTLETAAAAAVPRSTPYFEFQVEKQAMLIPGTGSVRFPDALRSSAAEGEVLAQFIVTEEGRYESGSFKVLKSSHELFAQAVKSAMPDMRFYPAQVGGKSVPQLVQHPFTFSLAAGGGEDTRSDDYPPQPIEFFMPPLPPPASIRGFRFVAEVDVSSEGKQVGLTFSPTSDAAYNRRLEQALQAMRFRPATRRDGTPVSGKARIGYEF